MVAQPFHNKVPREFREAADVGLKLASRAFMTFSDNLPKSQLPEDCIQSVTDSYYAYLTAVEELSRKHPDIKDNILFLGICTPAMVHDVMSTQVHEACSKAPKAEVAAAILGGPDAIGAFMSKYTNQSSPKQP